MGRGPLDRGSDASIAEILETLADEDCRRLVEAMDAPQNASSLSEESEVPLSTTYRKLDRLEAATLVEELIEIRDDGRHTSQYRPDFDRIVITLNDEQEFEVELTRPTRTADERLEHLWTEVRKGV